MSVNDRIATTHVGSLVRPPELTKLLESGTPDPVALEECLKRSVAEVVREQLANGVDIVSDGEFSKSSWAGYATARLKGLHFRPKEGAALRVANTKDRRDFADFYAEYEEQRGPAGMGRGVKIPAGSWVVTEEIRYAGQAVLKADIARFKAALAAAGAKRGFLPVVAPSSALLSPIDEHYRSYERLMFGLGDALREEYKAIIEAGLDVQIDDAMLAFTYDLMVPPQTLEDYRKWARIGVEALNHAIRGLPAERIRYHVCWGSWNGPHTNDVNAREIIDLILAVNAGAYALEMANPRHEHEWRLWEIVKLPAGRRLLPGVISHCTNVVEHPELVCERIVRLARLVGRENVIASTDCGFAQGTFTRRVHPSIQWAKLRALAEGARLATEELWPDRKLRAAG